MKKFFTQVFPMLLVVLGLLVTSCGPKPTTSAPSIPVSVSDWKPALDKVRTHYNGGVVMEGSTTKLRRAYEQTDSAFRLAVADEINIGKMCFKDAAAADATVANAIFDQQQDNGTLINALVTQSVTGQSTPECAPIYQKLAEIVASYRPAIMDAYLLYFNQATDYKTYTSAWPEIDVMNDIFQTVADPTQVAEILKENGLPGFTDFTWLPTENLYMDFPGNKAKCDYYTSGQFMNDLPSLMLAKFQGHEQSLRNLYEARWMPMTGANGNCRLLRQAALDEMTVSILSQGTQDVINSGIDTGAVPTVQP